MANITKVYTRHYRRNQEDKMSDQTVTLVRHHSGFDNVPDSFAVHVPGAWHDEYTEDLATYMLPAGYTVAETKYGELAIWDQRNQYCEIVQHTCGRPQLVSIGKGGVDPQMPVLTRAAAA